jgi:hypothetical protein
VQSTATLRLTVVIGHGSSGGVTVSGRWAGGGSGR